MKTTHTFSTDELTRILLDYLEGQELLPKAGRLGAGGTARLEMEIFPGTGKGQVILHLVRTAT